MLNLFSVLGYNVEITVFYVETRIGKAGRHIDYRIRPFHFPLTGPCKPNTSLFIAHRSSAWKQHNQNTTPSEVEVKLPTSTQASTILLASFGR